MNIPDDEPFTMTVVTLEEFAAVDEPDDRNWGPWRLDPDLRVLHTVKPYRYEIDLDQCSSSAQVLDWICQIAGKTWADDVTLAGLVRAIDT